MDDMSTSPPEASPDAHYDFGSFCHFDLQPASQLTPYELSDSISLQLIDPALQPDCTGVLSSNESTLAGSGLPEDLVTSHHTYHGSSASADQPWNPIALTTNSMTTIQQHQMLYASPSGKIPTDSGYGDSLLSVSQPRTAHKASRSFRHRQHIAGSLDTRMEQTQILPELSLSMKKSRSMKSHDLDASDKMVQVCPTCSEKLNTKSEYAKHMARHEKPFVCDVANCHRTNGFATKNDLGRHQRSVHKIMTAADKVWRCWYDGCKSASKNWDRLDNFRAHISRMHKDADVDQLVRKSDDWFEKDCRPRQSLSEEQRPTLSDHASSYSPDGDVSIDNRYNSIPGYDNDPLGDDDEDLDRLNHIHPTISITPTDPFDPSTQHLPSPHSYRINHGHSHVASDPSIRADRFVGSTPMRYVHSTSSYYPPTSSSPSQRRTDDPTLPPSQLIPLSHFDYTTDFQNFSQSVDLNMLRPPGPRTVPEPVSDRQADNLFPEFMETSPIDESGLGLEGHDPHAFSGIGHSLEDIVIENYPAYAPELSQLLIGDTQNTHTCEETRVLPSHDDQRSEKLEQQLSDVIRRFNVEVSPEMLQEITSLIKKESCATSQASVGCNASSSNRTLPPSFQSFDMSQDKKDAPRKCSHCPKTFMKKNVLKKHEQRHKKMFFCTFDRCRKKFGTKQDLQRHEMHACDHQKQCWRCFDDPTAKGKTVSCSRVFYDKEEFGKHRKNVHHESRHQKAWDRCHVEKGFAGPFWCGFCNKVVDNPVEGGYNGSLRIKYRYDHIEKHIKDEDKSMGDWYELGGNGKQKPESRSSVRSGDGFPRDDDDSISDTEDISPEDQGSSPELFSTLNVSSLLGVPDTKQESLAPPPATSFGRKRTASMVEGNIDPRSAKCLRTYDRDSALQEFQYRRAQAERAAASRRNNSPVAYIKCCHCRSDPRCHDGVLTCPTCFHTPCRTCQFFKSDFTQLNPCSSRHNC